MSKQKILSKGNTPATKEDIKNLEDDIYTSLMITPDRVLDEVIENDNSIMSGMGNYEVRVRDKANNIIDSRNTIRYSFYKTFGADFTEEEAIFDIRYFTSKNLRTHFISFLVDRVTAINTVGPCLYYKNEVDRILQDFNDAIQITISKYNEYQKKHDKNTKPYEESDIKKLLDNYSNCMYDNIRIFNRTIEDNQITAAEAKLQMGVNKQSKE